MTMWSQWQVSEHYDWDKKDKSFRKTKRIGEPTWFDIYELNEDTHQPDRTPEMIHYNQYWYLTGEPAKFQKERPE